MSKLSARKMLRCAALRISAAGGVVPLHAALAAALCAGSCSGEIGPLEPGVLSLQLQPAAAVRLSSLEYTVSHEDGFVRTGPVAVGDQQDFSFQIDTLPPAYGYTVTAYAEGVIVSANAPTVCTGHATFEIKTAQATAVSMPLQCEGIAYTGTEHGGSTNRCPSVGGIAAAPSEAPLGKQVSLRAEVADDTDGPLPLQYEWSAGRGLLGGSNSSRASFTCDQPGVVSVSLAVSDGDAACSVPPAMVFVTCTDSQCVDLTHCPNSPVAQAVNHTTGVAGASAGAGVAGRGATSDKQAGAAGHRAAPVQGAGGVAGTALSPRAGSTGGLVGWPKLPGIMTTRGQRDSEASGVGGQTSEAAGSGGGEASPTWQAPASDASGSAVGQGSTHGSAGTNAPAPAVGGEGAPPVVDTVDNAATGLPDQGDLAGAGAETQAGGGDAAGASGAGGASSGAVLEEPAPSAGGVSGAAAPEQPAPSAGSGGAGAGGVLVDIDVDIDEPTWPDEHDRRRRRGRQPAAGSAGVGPRATGGVSGAMTSAP